MRRLLIKLNCTADVSKKFGFMSALLGRLEYVRFSVENSCIVRFPIRNFYQYYYVTKSYKVYSTSALVEAEERVTPLFPSLLELAKCVAV